MRSAGASDLDWLDELVSLRAAHGVSRMQAPAGSFLPRQDRRDFELGEDQKQEKDARFVELGDYLCEVRSKQYCVLEAQEFEVV